MSEVNNITTESCKPWKTPWPENELESVPNCPVCGSFDREVLCNNLIDNVFFVAQGSWTLQSCKKCQSAYLDPRPNQESIGKAYGTYYTHAADVSAQVVADKLSFLRKVRRSVVNGYLNQRFGTSRLPVNRWGYHLVKIFSRQRQQLDSEFRYLPSPMAGQRVLDIGCGNGAFLAKAKTAGWLVAGIDLDPKAVETALGLGIDAQVGTIALFLGESNCFDAITLNHVVEHVHDPIGLLRDIFRLLRPGGVVYVETPNIESFGSQIYQENWRGNETPRHLVIFNHDSLKDALSAVGFEVINIIHRKNVTMGIFSQSENMRNGLNPLNKCVMRGIVLGWAVSLLKIFLPNKSEFITIVARKPL